MGPGRVRLGRGAHPLRAHELADGARRLGAAVEPVADAFLVEDDLRRLGLGVVAPDRLDDATVAGRALVGDDDAPDRVLPAAHTGQPHSYGQSLRSPLRTKDSGRAVKHSRASAGA